METQITYSTTLLLLYKTPSLVTWITSMMNLPQETDNLLDDFFMGDLDNLLSIYSNLMYDSFIGDLDSLLDNLLNNAFSNFPSNFPSFSIILIRH